jgi:hypothetical protein
MSGFMGAIEGVVGGMEGAFGGGDLGGDFLSELMDAFAGSSAQGNGSTGEVGQIASDVLPLVAAFL